MAHTFQERKFLVEKAIELGIFKTLSFDAEHSNQKEYIDLVNQLKSQNIDPDKVYRVVSILPNGTEKVVYTPKENLIELLKDEEGFDFVWKAIKNEVEEVIDEERGSSFVDREYEDDYEDILNEKD